MLVHEIYEYFDKWMFEISAKNGPSPGSFSFIFRRFKHTIVKIVLQQINVKKCPSSIRCWDLNPQPSEHESPSITTRPELPPTRPFEISVIACYLPNHLPYSIHGKVGIIQTKSA